MDIVSLAVQLISGALGGNIAGTLLKSMNLGTVGNALAGIVGGSVGGQMLNSALGVSKVAASSGMDVGTVLSQIAGGGVGGGILMVVIGLLQRSFAK